MNKTALIKGEICNKLTGLTEYELATFISFIDFMRYKKEPDEKKIIKLEGIIKDHPIDFSDLKKFRKETWKHLDDEFENE